MSIGFAWDIWPRDTSRPRIAIGHAMSNSTAREMVERYLEADDSAFAGTIDQPFAARWLCRRGREEGTFVWRDITTAGMPLK